MQDADDYAAELRRQLDRIGRETTNGAVPKDDAAYTNHHNPTTTRSSNA